ncbi:MAG: YfiR family protein [Marinilabiliaceae bacterium]|nr:YfiR family protein [Marinilabiliaceae bacterium]
MKRVFILFLFMVVMGSFIHAQQELFKSLFIYSFTNNINWPSEFKNGDFVITVVGQDGIVSELKKLAQSKKVGPQTIKVVQVNSASEIGKSNIVYVSTSKSSTLSGVSENLKNSPTLVISDQNGGCKNGAGINFVLVDGKMKFEIAPQKLTSIGLQYSPKLTGLGIVVE